MDEDRKTPRRSEPERGRNEEQLAKLQSEQEDEQTIHSLQEGLRTMDRLFSPSTPSSAWYEQRIAETHKKQRLRLLRDLLTLWLGALTILYLLYAIATSQPLAFLSLQAAAVIVPIAWLLLRKRVDLHEES
ncbi:hypothetical protein BC351_05270 [Paenibacillus ferrarius]|uniref:YxlC family protein n=1 Tax=Paenibacillus ferrarius TaxID=1469647 RepID=A0A1V4HFV9_9BACL|nr:DUF5345 family protein [Paenibacillus ferrarius]OPH53289.1 hypothetical protein BC351_05270 [Paenibacillus ferrarius]